ncbi:MAG: O-antigen ligase family protein [Candidatus Omnitrophica bacterium]|nr:O-antigen ligase family protein [Candidatus Omnitrophota bacterium]MDD5545949.1 O-antigen ligase family protein [Candidatus Omnitrophota bacterium]
MSADRQRLYAACDKVVEYMLYTLVFFIPTSKSVVEVFATLSIMIWLYKNGLKAWEWTLGKMKSFVPPASTYDVLKILVPVGILAVLLVYSSIMISLAVISHHFDIEGDLFVTGVFLPITLFAIFLNILFFIVALAVARSNHGFSLKASTLSFMAVSLITSAFTSQRLGMSAEAFLFKTMEYLLIFLIMADVINTPRRVFNLVSSFLIAAFFSGIDGIYQRLAGYDLFRKFPMFADMKITAAFKAPNDFGTYVATMLPLPLALIAFSVMNWKKKIGLLVISLVLAACLLLTFARGAWLGFVAGFLFLLIFTGWKRLVAALIIVALLVSLTALIAPPDIKAQLGSLSKLGSDLSSMDRFLIWKTGWKMFLDRPLFGHGLNTFMSVFEKYKPASYEWIVYAHNCFLQIAAETGIIGLLVFLWFCVSVFIRGISKFTGTSDKFLKAAAIGAVACIIATLVNSFVDTNLYSLPLAVLFWSMCGLAVARVQPE